MARQHKIQERGLRNNASRRIAKSSPRGNTPQALFNLYFSSIPILSRAAAMPLRRTVNVTF
ncbi:hypothetical protein R69746_07989 [Paraburkholderia aspalathi]|nr:hypothetical protein R69746_07989 [Paraburkholderia aspalathi]CAE6873432.1 hypothetical protein R75465_08439 [Paraburkholderia aspalathi]